MKHLRHHVRHVITLSLSTYVDQRTWVLFTGHNATLNIVRQNC